MIGVYYNIPTPPAGDCPAMFWRFFVNADRGIEGTLARFNQPPFAILSGTMAADDSFAMTATEMQGKRTARATGRFTSQISTLSIEGDGAGPACNGQTFSLRLGRYLARASGGGGGGE
ncbi:MAG: hypothetical protein JSS43_01365 [Proteobacteria bacterium]|nr:hypothetical protein [Pseudomonadota bacterium]